MAAPPPMEQWPALQQAASNLSQSTTKSFADVLTGGVSSGDAVPSCIPDCLSSYRGSPALIISKHEISILSKPFTFALIGRFPYARPTIDDIRKFFVSLGLKGPCPIGLLDAKHILIRPALPEDYTRIFRRRSWSIQNKPMLISKWTIDFRANEEASLAPVWINLPDLPLPFFNKLYIYKIASLLGRPLQVDSATSDLRRPSVARVLVEVDIAKEQLHKVWIGDDNNNGFWQIVHYENWPYYCDFCLKLGHREDECFKKHPQLRLPQQQDHSKDGKVSVIKQVYMPKVNMPINPVGDHNASILAHCSLNEDQSGSKEVGTMTAQPDLMHLGGTGCVETDVAEEGNKQDNNIGDSHAEVNRINTSNNVQVVSGDVRDPETMISTCGDKNDASRSTNQLVQTMAAEPKSVDMVREESTQGLSDVLQADGLLLQEARRKMDEYRGAESILTSETKDTGDCAGCGTLDPLDECEDVSEPESENAEVLQLGGVLADFMDKSQVLSFGEGDIAIELTENIQNHDMQLSEKENNIEQQLEASSHILHDKVQNHQLKGFSPAEVVLQKNWRRLHQSHRKDLRDVFHGNDSDSEKDEYDIAETYAELEENLVTYAELEENLATPTTDPAKKGKRRRGRPKKKR